MNDPCCRQFCHVIIEKYFENSQGKTMDKTNEILLRAEQLKKSYGSGQSLTKALDDVSLEIHTG